jgi:hypothetical protein
MRHPVLDNKTFSFVLSGVDTGKNDIAALL